MLWFLDVNNLACLINGYFCFFVHKAYQSVNIILQYTPEEIEWYGLTWYEALNKAAKLKEAANKPVPLKKMYRKNLIEKLKEAGIDGSKSSADEISYVSFYFTL